MQETGSIHGSGRSLGEENGYPLQYSCLENHTDRGAWWATVHGVTRVGHDLVTKPAPPNNKLKGGLKWRPSLIKQNQLPSTEWLKAPEFPMLPGRLEEGNGTPLQYSCLENPWTEEPGRLQSIGSLRVGHD